jgi:signal transduction histidine kinase
MTIAATAARKWLEKVPPDLGEIKSLFSIVEDSGFRANEILSHVPKLFEDADREQEPIDMNNLALETLKILSGELNDHAVKTNLELTSELPAIMGHRVQLQEVILNLVRNAIDAMDTTHVERRSLTVRTWPDSGRPTGATIPNSARWARITLITAVCWRMNKCRVRWSVRQLCCSGVLVATNRIVDLVTASQIASASVASFFCRLT